MPGHLPAKAGARLPEYPLGKAAQPKQRVPGVLGRYPPGRHRAGTSVASRDSNPDLRCEAKGHKLPARYSSIELLATRGYPPWFSGRVPGLKSTRPAPSERAGTWLPGYPLVAGWGVERVPGCPDGG